MEYENSDGHKYKRKDEFEHFLEILSKGVIVLMAVRLVIAFFMDQLYWRRGCLHRPYFRKSSIDSPESVLFFFLLFKIKMRVFSLFIFNRAEHFKNRGVLPYNKIYKLVVSPGKEGI